MDTSKSDFLSAIQPEVSAAVIYEQLAQKALEIEGVEALTPMV